MAIKTWQDGNDNWTTAVDWNPTGQPGVGDSVVIGQGSPVVSSNVGTVQAVTLTANGGLNFNGAGSLATSGAFTNGGTAYLNRFFGDSGASLTIGGTLTNSSYISVGNSGLTTATTATAGGVDNTGGRIDVTGASSGTGASTQGTLSISAAAGFGVASHVVGQVNLGGNALIQFASGQITTIDSNGVLYLDGAQSRVAIAGNTGANSALTGLASVSSGGKFELRHGASVATSGGLTNSGELYLDRQYGDGGSMLTIGGALTNNSVYMTIGNTGLTANTTVTATSVDNTDGRIGIVGDTTAGTTNQATLNVSSAAGFGTAGHVVGEVDLTGDALVQFVSGQITTIDAKGVLYLNGTQARVANASDLATNSALTGLSTSYGRFDIHNGVTLSTAGAYTNGQTVVAGSTYFGELYLDRFFGEGGSTLTIGGALTNNSVYMTIGNTGLSANTTLTATNIDNTGGTLQVIGNTTAGTTNQATLKITGGTAGFGTAGHVRGEVDLTGDALVQFVSGQITTIDAKGVLYLNGTQARVANASDLTTNSALTGLSTSYGRFDVHNGVTLSTTGAYTNGQTVVAGSTYSGELYLDRFYGDGGSMLTIGGALTNSTPYLTIGNTGLSANTTLTATSIDNTGGTLQVIGNTTAGTANEATLKITGGTAGFGTAGHVRGEVDLTGDALVQFVSGQITTIDAGGALYLNGAQSRVANASDLTTNSALTGLATVSNGGRLDLRNGTSITTTGALTNNGELYLDRFYGDGGTTLTVGGALTNTTPYLQIGNAGLSANTTLTATSVNNTGGTITIIGNTALGSVNLATLKITGGTAGFGLAGHVRGAVDLIGNALAQFVSGQITTIDASSELTLNGSGARVANASNLATNSALAGLTTISNGGRVDLRNGASVTTTGALTNNGELYVDRFYGDGGSTLTVGGALTNNTAYMQIGNVGLSANTTVTAASLTNNAGDTIQVYGNTAGGSTNKATLSLSGGGTNAGALNLTGLALFKTGANFTSSGQLNLNGGTVEVGGGTFNISGTASGTGAFTIDANATLRVGSSAGSFATLPVTFNGLNAALKLDAPGSFAGSISGFVGTDMLGLGGQVVTDLSYGGSTLTVTVSGGGTETFNLSGSFTGLASKTDGAGGSTVVAIANSYALTTGADLVRLLSGNNTVTSTAAALNSGDDLVGGPGSDTLSLTGAGSFNLSALAGFSGFEQITLDNSNSTLTLRAGAATVPVTAGSGSTTFIAGTGAFSAGSQINGGAGADTLNLAGDYSAGVTFGPSTLLNVETILLSAGNSYALTTNDATVAAGLTLTVNASALAAPNSLTFNGSAESNGKFNVSGGAGADTITGGALGDILDGGAGADALIGGTGDDTYYVDNSGDSVTESAAASGGSDTVFASANWTMGINQGVEILKANAGNTALTLTGNDLNQTIVGGGGADTLYGKGGNDTLNGGTGADTMDGGTGNDTFNVDDANDSVIEAAAAAGGTDTVLAAVSWAMGVNQGIELLKANAGNTGLTLTGNDLNQTIAGGGGVDTLYGKGGNDTLNGGIGADTMDGGTGNDIFYVDDANDQVIEAPASSGGTDTVFASVSWAMGANQGIELLKANAGNTGLTLTGNDLNQTIAGAGGADTLYGNGGIDTLNGGAGADTMDGGTGNDNFYVDDAGDQVIESSAATGGLDTVYASVDYTLGANQGIEYFKANAGNTGLTLTGNDLNQTITGSGGIDHLFGNGGVDTLIGGVGADVMDGGTGNDGYYVDNVGDQVIEASAATGGLDTVYASVSWTIASGQGVEYLRANAGSTPLTLTGNDLGQTIIGGGGNDTLIGNGGTDSLNGGAGVDSMDGGTGNDSFYVDNASDQVLESSAASGGTDTVLASTSWAMGANQGIEFLTANSNAGLTLTGNDLIQTITGGGGADTLYGNGGADRLDGGAGADTMDGGTGNDTFYVDVAGDQVIETTASSGGTDTVLTKANFTISATQGIEFLTANSSAGLTLVGNNLFQTITGGAGNDRIGGGGGVDNLTGGTGLDTFVFTTAPTGNNNVGRITDFNHTADTIELAQAAFAGLALGTLSTDAFYAGTAAHDADDRIIFNGATGDIFYDADGNGATKQVLFAHVNAVSGVIPTLDNTDFIVV